MLSVTLVSCMGEVGEKLKKAKQSASNATTFAKEAGSMAKRMNTLKEMAPMSNEDLKSWLPETLDAMERTRFRVGGSGMAKVSSVEGTYKDKATKKSLNAMVMDGAGEAGSVMAMSFGVFGNMDMEMEDEHKHQQTVEVNGIQAQQTYFKKNNRTDLMFVYDDRFMVTIKTTDMNPADTWELVEALNLERLGEL